MQSAESLPSGSLDTNRYQTDKFHQLSPMFLFLFLLERCSCDGRFYILLSHNRTKLPGEGEIENRLCRTKARAGRPTQRGRTAKGSAVASTRAIDHKQGLEGRSPTKGGKYL